MADKKMGHYIAQIEAHEMAMRIAEAYLEIKRPAGHTAEQGMQTIKDHNPHFSAACYRAALAAGKYVEEAINNFQRVQ